nr:MAG TPA: hypothetical protein [Caudoviricetes sp.]
MHVVLQYTPIIAKKDVLYIIPLYNFFVKLRIYFISFYSV